jgi:hypothetical protein
MERIRRESKNNNLKTYGKWEMTLPHSGKF